MVRLKTKGITLKELRLGATSAGEPTRPIHEDEKKGEVRFTQAWVSKRLHISQPALANIETGRQPASSFVLASMRTLYGVPLKVVYEAYAETRRNMTPPRSRRKT